MVEDLVGLGKMAEAVERITRESREVLSRLALDLLGPMAKEYGLSLGERARIHRYEAAIKTLRKAEEQIAASEIDQRPIPLKTLVLALEGASLEEDDDLITYWSGLLATAATIGNVLPSFTEILRQLSPEEARLIDMIFTRTQGDRRAVVDPKELRTTSGLGIETFNVMMESLARFGLIERGIPDNAFVLGPTDPWNLERSGGITILGSAFVRACRGPKKADPIP